MTKKAWTLITILLTLSLMLVGSVPMGTSTPVTLTSDRLEPSVISAVANGEENISVIVQASGDTDALKLAVLDLGGEIEADFADGHRLKFFDCLAQLRYREGFFA